MCLILKPARDVTINLDPVLPEMQRSAELARRLLRSRTIGPAAVFSVEMTEVANEIGADPHMVYGVVAALTFLCYLSIIGWCTEIDQSSSLSSLDDVIDHVLEKAEQHPGWI